MSLEETTVSRSTLDKPLRELTEDDISQLTREDCRRYLKDKGMRRPSWNKSQAIQQVISLKTLLEASPDLDTGARKKLNIPRPDKTNRTPVPAEESESPSRPEDEGNREHSGDLSGSIAVNGSDSVPPRTASPTNDPAGQLTIFYCGKVNVYDDVPAEKARTLLQYAASPHQLLPQVPSDGTPTARQHFSNYLPAEGVKLVPDSPSVVSPLPQTVNMTNSRLVREESRTFHEDNCMNMTNSRLVREESRTFHEDNCNEATGNRKASVQRYLEKRKDRFKGKRKVTTASSASLDIYLNRQMGNQTQNDRTSRSEACSPPHIRPPDTPIRDNSVESSLMKNANLSVG